MNVCFFTRNMAVDRCPTRSRRTTLLLAALLLAFGAALPFLAPAHEGENHGTPEPVTVAAPGETLLAASSGSGSLFEAVLKYRPFAPGESVDVTLYLVSAETNRPIAGATLSASLSEGDRSTNVAFAPRAGGPVGAYRATLTPATAAPMSWLFDVTAGGDSDLIGVTGFRASLLQADPALNKTTPHREGAALPPLAVLMPVGALLLVAAFAAGRATARKGVSA
jgi:hypothetical protein